MKRAALLLLLVATFGCASGDPYRQPLPRGVSLRVLSVDPHMPWATVSLELSNRSSKPFLYTALAEPVTIAERLVGSTWFAISFNDCGTGMHPVELKPGETVRFDVPLIHLPRKKRERMRVTLNTTDGPNLRTAVFVVPPAPQFK